MREEDRALAQRVVELVPGAVLDRLDAYDTGTGSVTLAEFSVEVGRVRVSWQQLTEPLPLLPPEGTPFASSVGYRRNADGELVTIEQPVAQDGTLSGYRSVGVTPEGFQVDAQLLRDLSHDEMRSRVYSEILPTLVKELRP